MDEESGAGANASTSGGLAESDSWQATASAIATDAASLYKSKSYAECLALLQQLLVKKESDPKVLLNVALTEFHRDGCADYNKLLDLLQRLKTQCEDLARAADDQVAKTSESVGYIDEYDSSIPVLNIASVHYHLQDFVKALEVLEPLFSNIEPVDEDSAKQICLLMLDLALGLRQPAKAGAVIRYMEKSYGLTHNLTSESTGSLQPQATPQQTPAASNNSLEGRSLTMGIRPTAMPASLVSSPGADNSLAQGPGEETFEEDALSIGLELDGTPSSRSSALPARLPEKSSPAPADKLFLHLYKVRFLILTRNLKAAKREVKSALNLSKDNMTALLLKAQLEYLRGNYPKALKLLTNCNSINKEPTVEPMIHSNLGCVYHKMRKAQSATQFFVSALRKYDGLNRKSRTKTLWTISQDKSCTVYYNVGLQKLLSGDPVLAASLFQDAAYSYQTKPIYWIRLAECCLSALELGLLQDAGSPRKDKLEAVLVGESMWRRLVLPSGSMNPTVKASTQQGNEDAETQGKKPLLSLPFAKKCLRRAHFLLRSASKAQDEQVARQEVPVAAEDVTAGEDTAVPNTPLPPSTTTGGFDAGLTAFDAEVKKEKALLESWILVSWAFVELCLGDPKSALLCANILLVQPDVSRIYRCLGHIYAAEALCFLGRLKEAEEQLRSCLVHWMEASAVESAGQADVTEEDFARLTGLQARASLYVNLAAVHAMEGNLDQAQNAARQALAFAPGSTMAVLAMVYVDLVEGRSKEALDRLKAFRYTSVSKLKV